MTLFDRAKRLDVWGRNVGASYVEAGRNRLRDTFRAEASLTRVQWHPAAFVDRGRFQAPLLDRGRALLKVRDDRTVRVGHEDYPENDVPHGQQLTSGFTERQEGSAPGGSIIA